MKINPNNIQPPTSFAGLSPSKSAELTAKIPAKDLGKIRDLAENFEAIFVELMLKSMRDTVGKAELVDGGNAEDIYRSMLDSEYSKVMAAQRNSGIANAIEQYMVNSITGSPQGPQGLPPGQKRATIVSGSK